MKSQNKNQSPDRFKNGKAVKIPMTNSAVPLLCVDKSGQSKKAVSSLEKSNKKFEVRQITNKSEQKELRPPVLFAIEGVFRGINAIDAYATSLLGRQL